MYYVFCKSVLKLIYLIFNEFFLMCDFTLEYNEIFSVQ